jgi:REP element-mobilizing transposase RayT
MANHYHLLVYTKTDGFSQSVMQPFSVSYTKAINKQQNRVGPLFQGPFQARLVKNEAYLLELTTYIHLNPVHAGLVHAPEAWEYSSYRDYIGLRLGTLPQPEHILNQFSD